MRWLYLLTLLFFSLNSFSYYCLEYSERSGAQNCDESGSISYRPDLNYSERLNDESQRVNRHYISSVQVGSKIVSSVKKASEGLKQKIAKLNSESIDFGDNFSKYLTNIGSKLNLEHQREFINEVMTSSGKIRKDTLISTLPFMDKVKEVSLTNFPKGSLVLNQARMRASSVIGKVYEDCQKIECNGAAVESLKRGINHTLQLAAKNATHVDYLNSWGEDISSFEESLDDLNELLGDKSKIESKSILKQALRQESEFKKVKSFYEDWDLELDEDKLDQKLSETENIAEKTFELQKCIRLNSCDVNSIKEIGKYLEEKRVINKIINTQNRIENYKGKNEHKETSKDFLEASTDQLSIGNTKGADELQAIANGVLDIGLGLVPVISVGKDLYELVTGKNAATGDELDSFDRVVAGIGVVTLGLSNYGKTGLKVLKKLRPVAKLGFEEVLEVGGEVYSSARKSGLFSGSKFKELKSNTSYETVKSFFRELDGKVTLPAKKSLVRSFDLKTIRESVLDKDLIVYRWHNNDDAAKRLGRFVSDTSLSDKDVARRLLALPSSNKMLVMEKYKIPKGTKIFRGKVAPFYGHPGGGSQIFITGQDINKLLIPILD